MLDLRCNLGKRVSLRRRKVGLFVFGENLKQEDRRLSAVIVVDRSYTTTLASSALSKSNLPDPSRTCQNLAP